MKYVLFFIVILVLNPMTLKAATLTLNCIREGTIQYNNFEYKSAAELWFPETVNVKVDESNETVVHPLGMGELIIKNMPNNKRRYSTNLKLKYIENTGSWNTLDETVYSLVIIALGSSKWKLITQHGPTYITRVDYRCDQ